MNWLVSLDGDRCWVERDGLFANLKRIDGRWHWAVVGPDYEAQGWKDTQGAAACAAERAARALGVE